MAGSRQDKATTRDRDSRASNSAAKAPTTTRSPSASSVSEIDRVDHAVQRALASIVAEAAPDVRKLELDRLDALQIGALTVLRRPHYVVSAGKIVKGDQGQPLLDDGPTLAAIDELLLMERRAKLLGLDAPTQVDLKVMTLDQMDDRIAELHPPPGRHRCRSDSPPASGCWPPAA